MKKQHYLNLLKFFIFMGIAIFGFISIIGTGSGGNSGYSNKDDSQKIECKDSQKIYNQKNGNYYQRIAKQVTWTDARKQAIELGGYLATITSREENDFIYNNLVKNNCDCWLGGTDDQSEGNWQWVTGEAWDYYNWSSDANNPQNFINDYIGMKSLSSGQWNDYAINSSLAFICEWDNETDDTGDSDGDGGTDPDNKVGACVVKYKNCAVSCEKCFQNYTYDAYQSMKILTLGTITETVEFYEGKNCLSLGYGNCIDDDVCSKN
ncbi:MAG: hypothetical protein HQK76_19170 [Desulfobacterales bacterium]|nr:hypothetical protein [Desulfobacterales bacterium]